MVGVICEGLTPRSPLASWAQSLQSRFRIEDTAAAPGSIRVRYSDRYEDAPWRLYPSENLVVVSSWRSDQLARFAGRQTREYLLLTGVLALTQFRTLILNPLLKPVDFIHRCEKPCLFAHEPEQPLERFLLAADRLEVCHGCGQFYCCLGAEPEWVAVRQVLRHFSAPN
ncbi:MAG: hypothetical protein WD873_04805 [Candidatus Hydrogenedentales bacterium]